MFINSIWKSNWLLYIMFISNEPTLSAYYFHEFLLFFMMILWTFLHWPQCHLRISVVLFLPFHSLYLLLFIFSCCHIALTRTSSIFWMLNESSGEGHPCFLPSVKNKIPRFSLLSMISNIYIYICRFLNKIPHIILYFSPECFFFLFIMNKSWVLSNNII